MPRRHPDMAWSSFWTPSRIDRCGPGAGLCRVLSATSWGHAVFPLKNTQIRPTYCAGGSYAAHGDRPRRKDPAVGSSYVESVGAHA